jgi:LmbE family N-acetylglucosaminyl deacetylase
LGVPGGESVVVKHIYVSPHADDVALSCGGQIIANSAGRGDIMVLNVFTSEMQDVDGKSGNNTASFVDSINAFRTLEDRSAWESLGVRADYLNLPEALLRKRFPFELFRSGKDDSVMGELFDLLRRYAADYPDAIFYFPAGFGNHIDHVACRKVAFRLLDEGVVGRIMLYEDIPYSWLRFIRKRYYRLLLRGVELERSDLARAFRADGLGLLEYMRGKMVPFPRGKKLFLVVWAALGSGNLLRGVYGDGKHHAGRVSLIELDEDAVARKTALLFRYESQIPMLFGAEPVEMLRAWRQSFATEVLIEISKKRAAVK